MTDERPKSSSRVRPARMFWLLGMVVGIVAGGIVAVSLADRVAPAQAEG